MSQKKFKTLNIVLWVVQGLLAAFFMMVGFTKMSTPLAELAVSLPWVTDMSPLTVRLIGFSEVLAALGLILPAALRILPRLTVLAGVGIVIIMVLASSLHISRGEYPVVGLNVVLASLAGFIVRGRSRKAVIEPRSSQNPVTAEVKSAPQTGA